MADQSGSNLLDRASGAIGSGPAAAEGSSIESELIGARQRNHSSSCNNQILVVSSGALTTHPSAGTSARQFGGM